RSLMDAMDEDFMVYPMNYLLPRSFESEFRRRELALPTIKDNKYQVALDLRNFDPAEIAVKCDGDSLQIRGRREKKSEDGHRYEFREYVQHFKVPDTVQAEKLQCKMNQSGYLEIEAPVKQP